MSLYKKSGVNYDFLDPIKKLAQEEGLKTKNNLPKSFKEISESRGESTYILETKDAFYTAVIEGLGTKNLIADEFRKVTKKTYYDVLAQDTVAMIVNDLITVGARPLSISAYWATGSSDWWKDRERANDLIRGWKKACDQVDCTWGGGETPTLSDVINPKAIDLAGSAIGVIKPKSRLTLGDKIKSGDVIVFLESSGIHANGLSAVRKLVKKISKGYKEKLANGKMFGEELLKPTHIYSKFIQEVIDSGVDIHYMINITGHGLRKLMRLKKQFTYVVEAIPKTNPLFTFIQNRAKLNDKEMYSTFNMGIGFAFFINDRYAGKIFSLSKKYGFRAWVGGFIEKGPKQIVLKPLNIRFHSNELSIR